MPADLPIVEVLPALRQALRDHRNLVLQAPPGAGKSTRVPLELLAEPWAKGKRIVMLEPRRLATRAVAARMAQTLGEPVGRTVGYRMRLDSKVSSATRIEVVTEGVLSAILNDDPALEDVACVVFDEFHERSLQVDLGLALCLDVQANINERLRLLLMSATIEGERISQMLGGAPIVRSEGRSYPVEVRYAERAAGASAAQQPWSLDPPAVARQVAATVRRALSEQPGDLLVFLPGAAEIRRVESLITGQEQGDEGRKGKVLVLPLFGDLSQQDQDRALQPSPPGSRKVVLSTNIAETSLTIEGVGVVVDSGLSRRSRFDPVSGMSRLETLKVSRASADQRCGRAGRLGPGACYRLWTESAQRTLEPHTPAEILEADLAPLALELAGWNVTDPDQLRWLDPPPAATLAQARELLVRLGALDKEGRITAHGREMLRLRVHPRLAHMLIRGRQLGLAGQAADLAALLSERDILRTRPGERDADLRSRLDVLRDSAAAGPVDRGARERVRRSADQFRRQLGDGAGRSGGGARRSGADGTAREAKLQHEIGPEDATGVLLALAYPDRVARARGKDSGRYLLSNGRGAFFAEPQVLARSEFLAIAELDGAEREARIFLAAPISRETLEQVFAEELVSADDIRWNARERAVIASRARMLGSLVIEEAPLKKPDPERVADALTAGIRELSLDVLPWTRDLRDWQARVQFVRGLPAERDAGWPDVSDAGLMAALGEWLRPLLDGMSRIDHLARLDLGSALTNLLDWKQRARLEELAPTHVGVPSGSRIRIDYQDGDTPLLSVRLQEMFGLQSTPRIGGGTVALVIKLLSPAQRPVQVTRDLASFWRNGYAEVRKELKGRYPKHYWPEDPLQAEPRRGNRRSN